MNNFVVQTAGIGGAWSGLTTTVDTAAHLVCGTTDHLTLFELSARVPTALPTTGAEAARIDLSLYWLFAALALTVLAGAGVLVWRTRRA